MWKVIAESAGVLWTILSHPLITLGLGALGTHLWQKWKRRVAVKVTSCEFTCSGPRREDKRLEVLFSTGFSYQITMRIGNASSTDRSVLLKSVDFYGSDDSQPLYTSESCGFSMPTGSQKARDIRIAADHEEGHKISRFVAMSHEKASMIDNECQRARVVLSVFPEIELVLWIVRSGKRNQERS